MELLNTISNTRTWNRHGSTILLAASALFLSFVLGWIAWDIYSKQQVRNSNYAAQDIPAIRAEQKTGYSVRNIINANLFGAIAVKPVERPITKTNLNLKLQGILWDSREGMARAIITSGKKPAKLYAVGEEIKGAGASIKEIRGTEVLLNRNGATESLPLNIKTAEELEPFVGMASYEPSVVSELEPAVLSNAAAEARQTKRVRQASPNGEPRKIKRPNLSGLDKALRKMGEI